MYILIICNNPCSTWCYSTINKRSVSCVSQRNTSTATAAELFYILCSNTFHKDTWPANEKGKCFIKPKQKEDEKPAVKHARGERRGGAKQNESFTARKALEGFEKMAAWVAREWTNLFVAKSFQTIRISKTFQKRKKTPHNKNLDWSQQEKKEQNYREHFEWNEREKSASVPRTTEIIWTFFWLVCLFLVKGNGSRFSFQSSFFFLKLRNQTGPHFTATATHIAV